MAQRFEKHITVEESGLTALDVLGDHVDLSRQQLKQVMKNGALWLESDRGIARLRRASKSLQSQQLVHLYFDADIQSTVPPRAILIADEGEYSIWNKPSGMYSQGSKWGDHCTIYRWAEQYLQPQRPAFIVHRLDRAANGLIVLAHKKSVAAKFSKLFERRQIIKQYRAIVEGDASHLSLPFEVSTEIDGKPAISTLIPSEKQNELLSEVCILIKTGRKHQIRKQLSELGYPISGDRLYGAKDTNIDLQLTAYRLEFICPLSGKSRVYRLD